jgi:tetratricopeptide (TPR) repeat protein
MSHARLRAFVIALAWSFAASSRTAAAPAWIEVKSPHFTAVSDAGEGAARRTLWQFEQIRAALVKVWPWARVDSGSPYLIFAVRDENSLKTLGPQYWEGKRFRPVSFGATGRDRRYIAVRTDLREPDEADENPYQSVYWSYVSSVLGHSFPRPLPLWYSRGVSELWSNTRVREKEIQVGRLLHADVERVRRGGLIPPEVFLSADRKSRWVTRESDVTLFDAQACVFVHYLIFGESGAHAAKFNRFSQLLMNGAAADVAVREALGDVTVSFDKVYAHVSQQVLPFARVAVVLDLDVRKFATRALSVPEAALVKAEELVAMERSIEARALAAEATGADPQAPGPFEIEAQLLDREGQSDNAREAYAKAAERRSSRAFVYYRLAQLEWKAGFDEARIKQQLHNLQRAHELDPNDANTLSFLADTLSALGREQEALPLAKQAVEKDPASSYHRLTLARVARDLGAVDDAVTVAQMAVTAADDDAERQRAQEFLDSLVRLKSRPNPASAAPALAAAAVVSARSAADQAAGSRNAIRIGGTHVAECFGSRLDEACAKAAPELEASCQAGRGDACRALGSLFDGGWGVKVDKARAAQAYDRGCRADDVSSCARLAVLEATGQGMAPEPVKGVSTLQRLCGQQVDDACIGWALVLASKPDRDRLAKARELLQTTCARQNEEACRILETLPR